MYLNNNMKKIKNQAIGESEQIDFPMRPYEIKITPRLNYQPPLHRCGKFMDAGDFITLKFTERKVLSHVRKISQTQYKNIRTGEIKEYIPMGKNEKKKVKRATLNRTFDELRGVIRANFSAESHNQLFITLTYAENMTDQKSLYNDFQKFMQRLIYAYKDQHKFEWVAVMEPQGRGAWHVHLMIKSTTQPILWIDKEEIKRIWRHGYTTTARLKSDDVGNYYTADFTGLIESTRLSDEELEFLELEAETGEDILKAEEELEPYQLKKSYVKGARLDLYPAYFKFYRCSRGITRPDKYDDYIYDIENDERYKKTQAHTYDIEKHYTESTDDAEIGEIKTLNTVHRATYRLINTGNNDENGVETVTDGVLTDSNSIIKSKLEIVEQMRLVLMDRGRSV